MIYSFVKQKIPSSRRSWNEGDGFVPSPCVYVLVLAKRRQDSEVWSVSKTLLQFEFTSAVSRCPEDPYTQIFKPQTQGQECSDRTCVTSLAVQRLKYAATRAFASALPQHLPGDPLLGRQIP